jgi:uncharacterized protein YbbC (DUF1343 family)
MIYSMKKNYKQIKNTFLFLVFINAFFFSYSQNKIQPGAEDLPRYINLLEGKKVGIVANLASQIKTKSGYSHIVDTLFSLNVDIKNVFAPEHGFRGDFDAGEKIDNKINDKTGVKIISLYGEKRKPKYEDLKEIEVLIFDLQDVGVRFYTYISTLHYVMEACAENNIPVIILDRPNPNSHYIDGPVLEQKNKSFVGMHPVPIVYGMTIGEYAKMINGEKWLKNSIQCDLTVIAVKNYNHKLKYSIPFRPSPNLPNDQSIYLYPSLCLLEPTVISVGRGTNMQFQVYGSPEFNKSLFSFIPKSNFGSKNPKHKGLKCYGIDLRTEVMENKISLTWLLDSYSKHPKKESFFLKGFDRIAGVSILKEQIQAGLSSKEIRSTWKKNIEKFKIVREKYLIYP